MSYNKVFCTGAGVFAAGLTGTLGYQLIASDGTATVARTTTGIVEKVVLSTSLYIALVAVPDDFAGAIVWDDAGDIVAPESINPLDSLGANAVTSIWSMTLPELTSVPAITATVLQALSWIYTMARNKITQSSTQTKLYRDDGATLLATSPSADDGSIVSRGKFS